MSYTKFSDESDVYVFPHIDGGFVCCACRLTPTKKTIFTTGIKNHFFFGNIEPCEKCGGEGCIDCMIHGNFKIKTRSEVIKHLKKHIENGDNVPQRSIDILKKEIETKGEYNDPVEVIV